MKTILALAAVAASTFVAQSAQAAYICGTDVAARNQWGDYVGPTTYGEHVQRTGGYATILGLPFVRVYFTQAPQGYGWVASQFVCGN